METPRLVEQVLSALRRDAGLPVLARAATLARTAVSTAVAPVWLDGCDEVGARVRTIGRPVVRNDGTITIGAETAFSSEIAPVELRAGPKGEVRIGRGCRVNFGVLISANRSVSIGDGVSIGPYAVIDDDDPAAGGPSPIEIGAGAWIASRVTVLPGARIGKGAVIGAGSVVQGEIPDGAIARGVPARVLKQAAPAIQPKAPPPVATGPAVRALIVSDFNLAPLAEALRSEPDGPEVIAGVAPFGQVQQTLLQPASAEVAIVWTRPEAAVPSFAKLLAFEPVDDTALLAEVDAFAALLRTGLAGYRSSFVATWTLPREERGLGMLDARPGGAARALALINLRLMDALAGEKSIFVLDAQRWLGAGGHSPRLFFLGKELFDRRVLAEAARDVKAALRGLAGGARKLLALDLDDTLWGGIVGDVGWEHLRLGGHDATGEAFVAFQRALKDVQKRGVVLAIVSKNTESVALEAMARHPEMVLREGDFVGWKIDWNDKAGNLADLARDLNLGLQSVVFIDDNPVERARVREALPEVLVPDWPEDKLLYASALRALRCFDGPRLSAEDAARTRLYAEDKRREAALAQVGSIDEWLRSLCTRVRVEPLGPRNLARAAQLLNKTNQMNLRTRRLTEAELDAWARGAGRAFFTLSVSDRFGDAGLTGLLGLERDGEVARVADFVLSCRVMGRRIEHAMLHLAAEWAREQSLSRVEAQLIPTAKNKPCADLFAAALPEGGGGGMYTFVDFTQPDGIALERAP